VKQIQRGLYTWHVFNEQKGLNFNGLYLQTRTGAVLIDPPPMSPEDQAEVEALGAPKNIYLTNKHHTRDSLAHRRRWDCPIFIHELDKRLMEIDVQGTFFDDEVLVGELKAIRIPDAKTPGECVLHWFSRKVLIVGDAIIGKDAGLAMLSDEKFPDPRLARQGLRVLQGLDYDCLLVGDGTSILTNARPVVEAFIRKENP
jgi:glyoxylase-like metal-dependent hydrolase (beta-lactamase superfamily II)